MESVQPLAPARDDVGVLDRVKRHWPEYLIEGWALGTFMVSAGVFATLLDYPGSAIHRAIESADLRRALVGLAMGLTAIALICSPWGQRSGAHMNPAVTLTFLRLGKIHRWDALFYILAQFVGGILGVLLLAAFLGPAFMDPPVSYVATLPGSGGIWIALVAELLISLVLIYFVLSFSNAPRFARYTGVAAGCLVALYITFEAPLSGMSMNPARSFASAAPAGHWQAFWIYVAAPVSGMLAGAQLFLVTRPRTRVGCAKLLHPDNQRCIHCGHQPT